MDVFLFECPRVCGTALAKAEEGADISKEEIIAQA